jgi:hypothetical protein
LNFSFIISLSYFFKTKESSDVFKVQLAGVFVYYILLILSNLTGIDILAIVDTCLFDVNMRLIQVALILVSNFIKTYFGVLNSR